MNNLERQERKSRRRGEGGAGMSTIHPLQVFRCVLGFFRLLGQYFVGIPGSFLKQLASVLYLVNAGNVNGTSRIHKRDDEVTLKSSVWVSLLFLPV